MNTSRSTVATKTSVTTRYETERWDGRSTIYLTVDPGLKVQFATLRGNSSEIPFRQRSQTTINVAYLIAECGLRPVTTRAKGNTLELDYPGSETTMMTPLRSVDHLRKMHVEDIAAAATRLRGKAERILKDANVT